MKTEGLFVPYELAVIAKELDFDEPCLGHYNHKQDFCFMTIGITNSDAKLCLPEGVIAAPLYQQIVDFAFLKYNKLLYYDPSDRDKMNLEIKKWLESSS